MSEKIKSELYEKRGSRALIETKKIINLILTAYNANKEAVKYVNIVDLIKNLADYCRDENNPLSIAKVQNLIDFSMDIPMLYTFTLLREIYYRNEVREELEFNKDKERYKSLLRVLQEGRNITENILNTDIMKTVLDFEEKNGIGNGMGR